VVVRARSPGSAWATATERRRTGAGRPVYLAQPPPTMIHCVDAAGVSTGEWNPATTARPSPDQRNESKSHRGPRPPIHAYPHPPRIPASELDRDVQHASPWRDVRLSMAMHWSPLVSPYWGAAPASQAPGEPLGEARWQWRTPAASPEIGTVTNTSCRTHDVVRDSGPATVSGAMMLIWYEPAGAGATKVISPVIGDTVTGAVFVMAPAPSCRAM
jgi:hypothetical protein